MMLSCRKIAENFVCIFLQQLYIYIYIPQYFPSEKSKTSQNFSPHKRKCLIPSMSDFVH